MALSTNASRALEQVKMGLYMLYGADYFTEEEWIKIDGLVHKGQYVFTRGPPNNLLEEPLMTFEDSAEDKPTLNVQIDSIDSFETTKKENVVGFEQQIPSPSSEHANSTDGHAETPNETSAEASSDEEHTQPTQQPTETAPMFDFSETTPPTESEPEDLIPKREPVNIPSNGGLALGYTQAQLDEIKAFNAGLTKAGKKGRPKYSAVEESYPSPTWSQPEEALSEMTQEQTAYPSPTPTEHDTRITSWAEEVNAQEGSTEIVAPIPTAPRKLQGNTTPASTEAVEQFVKAHGRKPKSINDVYQPNNPQFRPKRPDSRASNATTKTAKTTKTVAKPVAALPPPKETGPVLPRLNKPSGTILIAQSSATKTSKIRIDVRSGDKIRVLKHVSGSIFDGQNLRTNLRGQFPESIFKKAQGVKTDNALIEQQRMLAAQAQQKQDAWGHTRVTSVPSVISNGLDRVEGVNAAEWDDVPIVSKPRTTAPTPTPTRAPAGGLAASRFAVLADLESKSQTSAGGSEQQDIMQGMSRDEIGKIVDEKFAQIIAAQTHAKATAATPTGLPNPRKAPMNEPLRPVIPKTATCYFWATPNKDCRFTAEECRDLHAFLPSGPSEPANLRMGKPTWGALADYAPTLIAEAQAVDTSGSDLKFSSKRLTCWYWANDGKCTNTAEACKYLHEHTPNGVAKQPHSYKRSIWDRWSAKEKAERNFEDQTENGDDAQAETEVEGDGEGMGEFVLEEVTDGNDGWGNAGMAESVWGGSQTTGWESPSDKYKPPHIKALEEKALIEAVGW